MGRHAFTEAERAFLGSQRGPDRIATVDPSGMPHVVPTGWRLDTEKGDLVMTGRDVGNTRRLKRVKRVKRVKRAERGPVLVAVWVDGHDLAPFVPRLAGSRCCAPSPPTTTADLYPARTSFRLGGPTGRGDGWCGGCRGCPETWSCGVPSGTTSKPSLISAKRSFFRIVRR